MPAISAMVRQFTSPGDQILVQEPVYNMFYSVIEGNGRRVIYCGTTLLMPGNFWQKKCRK
ncbi:hypothetical protein OKX59_05085 [Lactobacillus delbrueckii subsp. indicus]|uniref:hypothetical protein n=1 Tax=Lactobacillus delbrueckii TaxID=1584 RepID=UPI001E62A949|nr:hypothetical protein [Lactobacillus delbrueckii]UYX11966.1 hypothetical protein OJ966_05425 [Lactobacillus delbrueckii]UYY83776.1 hypothetical protein OKX59_05085 [Lactobacillus delbrueckii subsp. indicus]